MSSLILSIGFPLSVRSFDEFGSSQYWISHLHSQSVHTKAPLHLNLASIMKYTPMMHTKDICTDESRDDKLYD